MRRIGAIVRVEVAKDEVAEHGGIGVDAQNVWLRFGVIASDRPLPTASTKTRSVTSSRVSTLSTSGNGMAAEVARIAC